MRIREKLDSALPQLQNLLNSNVAKPSNGSSPPKLGGVARRRFISRAGVVPEENHPVCAPANEASRHFLMGAATPPNLGGELPFEGFATFGIILISPMQP